MIAVFIWEKFFLRYVHFQAPSSSQSSVYFYHDLWWYYDCVIVVLVANTCKTSTCLTAKTVVLLTVSDVHPTLHKTMYYLEFKFLSSFLNMKLWKNEINTY